MTNPHRFVPELAAPCIGENTPIEISETAAWAVSNSERRQDAEDALRQRDDLLRELVKPALSGTERIGTPWVDNQFGHCVYCGADQQWNFDKDIWHWPHEEACPVRRALQLLWES